MPAVIHRARTTGLLVVFSLGLVAIGVAPLSAKEKNKPFIADPVSPKKSVRFYKANKSLQADRVLLTGGDTEQPGCHNLLKKTRIFKVLQIGYQSCSLYQDKGCAVSSLVAVQSEDQLHSSYFLTEGVGWYPQGEDERGVKIASWSCNMQLTDGEMRAETELVRRELNRLTSAQQTAQKKLEAASAALDKAEKAKNTASSYAQAVKAEAIVMGVIEPDPEPTEEADGSEDEQAAGSTSD